MNMDNKIEMICDLSTDKKVRLEVHYCENTFIMKSPRKAKQNART